MQRRDFLNTLAAGAGLVIPLGRHAWAADGPPRRTPTPPAAS